MDKQGFTDYLQEKNFVAGTINRYTKHIAFFLQHAEKEDIQITKADIRICHLNSNRQSSMN